MRDVAVIVVRAGDGRTRTASATRSSSSSRWCRRRCAASGMARHDIGFTISGSCDYLSGGPFTFVQGLDGVGAWPPVKESHVEMDAAWALYEAWVAIQTGEVDSAIIYGFGKSSLDRRAPGVQPADRPVHGGAAVAVDGRHGRAAGERAAVDGSSGGVTERDLAEVAARSRRDAPGNPHAIVTRGRRRRRPARPAGHPRAAARRRHRARSPTAPPRS